MSTGQSYVGGAPHATNIEGTVKDPVFNPQQLTEEEVRARFEASGAVLPSTKASYSINLRVNTARLNERTSVLETLIYALTAYQDSMRNSMAEGVVGKDATHGAEQFDNYQNCTELLMEIGLTAAEQVAINYQALNEKSVGELRYMQGMLLNQTSDDQHRQEFARKWLGRDYDTINRR